MSPPRQIRPAATRLLAALALSASAAILAAACGGDDPSGPGEEWIRPAITVTGVEDGAAVAGPVTIVIEVDPGTFEAELDGEPFISGSTVTTPGRHTLTVTARNGTATSSRTVDFTILAEPGGSLIVRFIDLGANDAGGGGDAVLVTDSTGDGMEHLLYDAGAGGVAGADPDLVGRRLESLGVDTLELLVLSHAHSDHFRGIPGVVARSRVRRFVHNGQLRSYPEYESVVGEARAAADSVFAPGTVLERAVGTGRATSVSVLPPLPDSLDDPSASSSAINEGSLGVRVRRGDFTLFLAGDGEVRANLRWRVDFASRTADVDVLKVGHHGGNDALFDPVFSDDAPWLGHTSPEIAVISANGTTHPRIRAVTRLRSEPGLLLRCTSTHGDVEIRVDVAGNVDVRVERNADRPCEPGDEATT